MSWDEDDARLVEEIRDALRDIAKHQASIAKDVKRFVEAADRNEAEAAEPVPDETTELIRGIAKQLGWWAENGIATYKVY